VNGLLDHSREMRMINTLKKILILLIVFCLNLYSTSDAKSQTDKLSNDDIKTGKYPESYKVKRKDKSIIFFTEMIADYGRIDDNYCPNRIEDLDLYLKDINKAVDSAWYNFRSSDPLLLEKHYSSILSSKGDLLNSYLGHTSTALKDIYIPYSDFDKYPDKANKILSRIQYAIDTIHKNGLKIYFGFSEEGPDLFKPITLTGCTVPGAQPEDLMKHPEYQSQVFNPTTGEFVTLTNYLDWTNDEAVEYMLKHLENILKKIKGIDYYDLGHEIRFGWYRRGNLDNNDTSEVMVKYREKLKGCTGWNLIPAFSEAGLKNYRKYLNDPNALFPSITGSVKTDRTFITDNPEDWKKWKDWIEYVYANYLHRFAETVIKANKDNPRFKSNILMIHSEMVHEEANPDKMLASPYIKGWLVEFMTSRMNRPNDFKDALRVKEAAQKNNKSFGLWVYVVPFNWYTFDNSKDVKWIRQWYINNLFEKFIDFGSDMMAICHILNLNESALPGNTLFRGITNNLYSESSTEIISILHKKLGLGEKLNKKEEETYNRIKQLPKVNERERVAQILPIKGKIELDGDLSEWDKSNALEVYGRNIVKGYLYDISTKEKYDSNTKEFDKNPIKTYYHYDKEGIYVGIEGPSRCLEYTIDVRINLDNPDNKSDKWIRCCSTNNISMQDGKFKASKNISGNAKINKGGNSYLEFYVPFKILPLGDEFEAKPGKVISIGLTFRLWYPVLVSEGGIPEILVGDIGMEELWGYGVFK
jgi:hypothetical protein